MLCALQASIFPHTAVRGVAASCPPAKGMPYFTRLVFRCQCCLSFCVLLALSIHQTCACFHFSRMRAYVKEVPSSCLGAVAGSRSSRATSPQTDGLDAQHEGRSGRAEACTSRGGDDIVYTALPLVLYLCKQHCSQALVITMF